MTDILDPENMFTVIATRLTDVPPDTRRTLDLTKISQKELVIKSKPFWGGSSQRLIWSPHWEYSLELESSEDAS
jgi:hypothetical protein